MACDAPHRRATRSWPKALGNRLYESLSALLGMMHVANLEEIKGALAGLDLKSAIDQLREQVQNIE